MSAMGVLLLVVVTLLAPLRAAAVEARCTELSTACLCSEPLQMTGFTGSSPAFNPNDSTTKECNGEASSGGDAVTRSPGAGQDFTASSDAAILARFPIGHSVTNFLRGPDNHTGIFFVAHTKSSSAPCARMAARWYLFYSSNFEFGDEVTNGLGNTKLGEFGPGPGISGEPSGDLPPSHKNQSIQLYGFNASNGWSPSTDCCSTGPNDEFPSGWAQWKNKWWRIELIAMNACGGSGYQFIGYRKNVTDGAAEEIIFDTSRVDASVGWTSSFVSSLTHASRFNFIAANMYREAPAGGFEAISHFMMAAWSTNAGQRIGAASEIEGGGALPPPGVPTNLRIEALLGTLGVLAAGALMAARRGR